MGMKYVLYRRVSAKDQGKSGLGLEAQSRDIALFLENYAEAPEVIGEFVEVESGANSNRPELTQAIDLARKAGATLLVAKLDRLSRNVAFIAGLLEDKKLAFKVAVMPYADKFQIHIYAALAEQEREFISQRTKAALAEAKAKGKVLGGLREATAASNIERAVAAKTRAEELLPILQPLLGASLCDLAFELNHRGITAPKGGAWSPTQVQRVLRRLDIAA